MMYNSVSRSWAVDGQLFSQLDQHDTTGQFTSG